MGKKMKCMADGGVVGADGMTDAQRAKRNAALSNLGMSTSPAPVQTVPVAPAQQAPAQSSPSPYPDRPRGIIGVIGDRSRQIDKASGYACGGKIKAHAEGGKISGPGTPTSDSIQAVVKDTGEQIRVANKERIVSQAQDQFLESVAREMGFKSLDAMLEAGTGKPVGPTIKGGKRAAEYGMSPEEEQRRIQAFGAMPPELGTGLNGITRTSPGASFMTGAKPGEMPSSAQGGFTQGSKSYNVNPTSQEGIVRVTAPGTSPLYTNVNPEMAVNQLAGMKSGQMRIGDGGFNLADQNERMAKSLGYSGTDDFNKQWRLRNDPVQQQAELAANGRPDAVAMRGQDIRSVSDLASAGIDMQRLGLEDKRIGLAKTAEDRAADRWNVERPGILAQAKDSDAVRSARQGLMDAIASGDQKAIERARTMAIAAGIKLDKPADNFDFKTGPAGNAAVQQLSDGGALVTMFGIDGKPRPAVTIPAPGAQQVAGGKRVGNSPHDEGTQLIGKDGKKYVVRNGQPVLVQ